MKIIERIKAKSKAFLNASLNERKLGEANQRLNAHKIARQTTKGKIVRLETNLNTATTEWGLTKERIAVLVETIISKNNEILSLNEANKERTVLFHSLETRYVLTEEKIRRLKKTLTLTQHNHKRERRLTRLVTIALFVMGISVGIFIAPLF